MLLHSSHAWLSGTYQTKSSWSTLSFSDWNDILYFLHRTHCKSEQMNHLSQSNAKNICKVYLKSININHNVYIYILYYSWAEIWYPKHGMVELHLKWFLAPASGAVTSCCLPSPLEAALLGGFQKWGPLWMDGLWWNILLKFMTWGEPPF